MTRIHPESSWARFLGGSSPMSILARASMVLFPFLWRPIYQQEWPAHSGNALLLACEHKNSKRTCTRACMEVKQIFLWSIARRCFQKVIHRTKTWYINNTHILPKKWMIYTTILTYYHLCLSISKKCCTPAYSINWLTPGWTCNDLNTRTANSMLEQVPVMKKNWPTQRGVEFLWKREVTFPAFVHWRDNPAKVHSGDAWKPAVPILEQAAATILISELRAAHHTRPVSPYHPKDKNK